MARIEMSEINNVCLTFSRDIENTILALDDLQEKIVKIKMMDSFKGKGADNIKRYLDDVNIRSIERLKDSLADIDLAFKRDIELFENEVDSVSNAVLDQSCLYRFEDDMRRQFYSSADISENVKSIIQSIDDISPHSNVPNFRPIEERYNDLEHDYKKLHNDIENFRPRHLDNARESLADLKKFINQYKDDSNSFLGKPSDGDLKAEATLAFSQLGESDYDVENMLFGGKLKAAKEFAEFLKDYDFKFNNDSNKDTDVNPDGNPFGLTDEQLEGLTDEQIEDLNKYQQWAEDNQEKLDEIYQKIESFLGSYKDGFDSLSTEQQKALLLSAGLLIYDATENYMETHDLDGEYGNLIFSLIFGGVIGYLYESETAIAVAVAFIAGEKAGEKYSETELEAKIDEIRAKMNGYNSTNGEESEPICPS